MADDRARRIDQRDDDDENRWWAVILVFATLLVLAAAIFFLPPLLAGAYKPPVAPQYANLWLDDGERIACRKAQERLRAEYDAAPDKAAAAPLPECTRVFFATPRERTVESPGDRISYGTEFDAAGVTHYGSAEVLVPLIATPDAATKAGRKTPPRQELLRGKGLKGKAFVITTVTGDGEGGAIADAWSEVYDAPRADASLRAAVEANERAVMLYIHGMATPFAQSVIGAAQLAVDLNNDPARFGLPEEESAARFPLGQPMVFSWPSGGAGPLDYAFDKGKAEQAGREHLTGVLRNLLEADGVGEINIIAYSMGSRVLAAALPTWAADYVAGTGKTVRIIYAAAEITRPEYRQLQAEIAAINERAPAGRAFAPSVTVYAAESDFALDLARHAETFGLKRHVSSVGAALGVAARAAGFWGAVVVDRFIPVGCRLGQSKWLACLSGPIDAPNHDVVDATGFGQGLDFSLLFAPDPDVGGFFELMTGHGAFANNRSVVADEACALDGVPAGSDERALTLRKTGYWRLAPTTGASDRCDPVERAPFVDRCDALQAISAGAVTCKSRIGSILPPVVVITEKPPEPVCIAPTSPDAPLLFALKDDRLTPEHERALDAFVGALSAAADCRPTRIEVVGYTDTAGAEGYNASLAARRAKNVKAAIERRLTATGIEGIVVVAEGRGETVAFGPDADEPSPTGNGVRAQANRRVVVTASGSSSPAGR